jgi:aminomethyltransferase
MTRGAVGNFETTCSFIPIEAEAMKELPLNEWHVARGAKMGEFAGYAMPLYYGKPIEEHHRVRREVGVFDISHMGQFSLRGDRAEAFLDHAITNDVMAMSDGQALYSPLCRADGGVLDDLIVYRHDRRHWRIIVNGATREKDFQWLQELAAEFMVELQDLTAGWCLFAVQGPLAFAKLAPHRGAAPLSLRYYSFAETKVLGQDVFLARTGYTGEPGCEIALPIAGARGLWERLTGELGIAPIGLAARDTLRLEACMALYGHELREEWNPIESGVGFAVKLDKAADFVGKAALQKVQAKGPSFRSVGVEVTGRGIPRADYPILAGGQPVGMVTSGGLSPTTGRQIALARIATPFAKLGAVLAVEIRGKPVEAKVVPKPFFQNPAIRA